MTQIQKASNLKIPPIIPCPHCNTALNLLNELSLLYFFKKPILCPNCEKPIDWWKTILDSVKTDFFLIQILAPIGAQSIVSTIRIKKGELFTIDFAEIGIPENAKILEIIYTPCGEGLFPLEIWGNAPCRHILEKQVTLYPASIPVDSKQTELDINVMVTWIPHSSDDLSWQNLVESFEEFSKNHYSACIIPANIAVESKLTKLLTVYLQRFSSKDRVEEFLNNGAVYSHQLNVLLPLISNYLKIPTMPIHILGSLNRLRKLRNEIAHYGKTEKSLTKSETAELIVSSLFGFYYFNLLNDVIGKLFQE